MRENLQKFEIEQVERIKKQNEMLSNILDSAKKRKKQNQINFDLLLADGKKDKLCRDNTNDKKNLVLLGLVDMDERFLKKIESKRSVDDIDLCDSIASSLSGEI